MRVFVSNSYVLDIVKKSSLSLEELAKITIEKLLEDCCREQGCINEKDDIDALYASNMLSDELENQKHLAPLFASSVGLHCESISINSTMASGSAALRVGLFSYKKWFIR